MMVMWISAHWLQPHHHIMNMPARCLVMKVCGTPLEVVVSHEVLHCSLQLFHQMGPDPVPNLQSDWSCDPMHGKQADNIQRSIVKHSFCLTKSGIHTRKFHVARIHIHRVVYPDSDIRSILKKIFNMCGSLDASREASKSGHAKRLSHLVVPWKCPSSDQDSGFHKIIPVRAK